jgi:hypothetical protein
MTPKQREIKARKLRLLAGTLYVEKQNDKLPRDVREELTVAHDAVCRAFNALEDDR